MSETIEYVSHTKFCFCGGNIIIRRENGEVYDYCEECGADYFD